MPIDYDRIFPGKQTTTAPPPAASAGTTQTSTAAPEATAPVPASSVPPALANLGAGFVQGAVRDPLTTLIPAGQWLEQNVPGVSWLDQRTGMTPQNIQAANQQYLQGAGQTTAGWLGRLGGNVAVSSALPIPGAGTTGIVGGALRGAAAGGLGSALTSGGYGENPLTAGIQGAVGGGAIGGATGALVRPVSSFLTDTAQRLGIDLSRGQASGAGGFLNRLEDLSAPFIGSGAGTLGKNQGAQMANVVQRAMGVPETGKIDIPMVNAARAQAGSDMGNIAGSMNIDGGAPVSSGIAGTPPMPLQNRLDQIYNQASTLGADTPEAKAADTLRNQITASMNNNGGTMPGSDLQRFVAYGNTLDNLQGHDNSQVQNVANQVRSALFEAARNTPTNPADVLGQFNAAQLRYKAAVTAGDAISKSGSTDAMTPLALKNAIFRHYADQLAANNTGAGYDMPDLARMIQAIPKFASSGTAERQTLYNLLLGGAGPAIGAFTSPAALSGALYGAAPVAALMTAGRLSRFGPSLGVPYVAPMFNAVGAYTNPLLPRLLGQGVGNLLTTGTMPQPGGTR